MASGHLSERDGTNEARERLDRRKRVTRMKSFADGVGESVVSVGGRAARCGAGEAIGAE